MVPWKVVEHTADVGIEAWGKDWAEAIAALIEGFTGLVCPDGEVAVRETRTIEVTAARPDDLIVDLLDELNFIVQTEGFLTAESKVTADADGTKLRVELAGESYDEGRHGHLMEIKAVTYHGLKVENDPPHVLVIVDI